MPPIRANIPSRISSIAISATAPGRPGVSESPSCIFSDWDSCYIRSARNRFSMLLLDPRRVGDAWKYDPEGPAPVKDYFVFLSALRYSVRKGSLDVNGERGLFAIGAIGE